MITNHSITAITSDSPLSWNPETVLQATLLTATLQTIFAYQATSIFYDLLLGLKQRHTSPVSHIHSLLLTDESSPLSIIASILRTDTLDQLRFGLPKTTTFTRVSQRIAKRTIIHLLLIFVCAPVINVIAVTLAIENDKTTTFAEADLKFAFGVGKDFVRTHRYIFLCERLEDSFKGDVAAQFYICGETAGYFRVPNPDQSRVKVIGSVQGDIRIEIHVKAANFSIHLNRYVDVSVLSHTYRLAHALDERSAAKLANQVAEAVERACDEPDLFTESRSRSPSSRSLLSGTPPYGFHPSVSSPSSSAPSDPVLSGSLSSVSSPPGLSSSSQKQALGQLAVLQLVSEASHKCETVQPDGRVGTGMFKAALDVLKKETTLVKVDKFLLADAKDLSGNVETSPTWIRGDDLPAIRTHSPITPAPWIAIAVGILMAIRIIIELFTNNDVADGIEDIVSAGLGFQDGYDLLRCDDHVRYDRKLQLGEQSHYGTAKPGWEEVDEFTGPVGVLWKDEKDEESYYNRKVYGNYSNEDSDDSNNS